MAVSLRIDLNQVSQDIASNTSKVRARVYAISTQGSFNNSSQAGWIKLNGVKYTFKHSFGANTTTLLYDTTRTISHNADGTKTVSSNASYDTDVSSGVITASKSLTLTKINRRSQINAIPSFNLQDGTNISITKYVSSYSDTLRVYLGTTLIKTITNVTNGYKLEFTEDELNVMYNATPNNKYVSLKAELTTYNGSSTVGSTSVNTVGIIQNANPTILEVTTKDTNTTTTILTGNNQKYISGYSTLNCYIKAVAQKGATIDHFVIDGNIFGASYNEEDAFYYGEVEILNVSKNLIEIYAVDSRNNNANQIINLDYLEYSSVQKGEQNINRLNSIGEQVDVSFSGNWWNGDFSDTKSNQITAAYKYKQTNSDEWITGTTPITLTTNDNAFSFEGALKGDTNVGFDIDNSYNLLVIVSDELDNIEFKFRINAGKPAIALFGNKVSLGDKYDEELGGLQLNGDNLYWNGEELFEQKVLWSDASYMTADQNAILSEKVSEQKNGIVLHWCAWVDGVKRNYDHIYTFIPKQHAIRNFDGGVFTFLTVSKLSVVGTKYVYVQDNQIRGHANNVGSSTVGGLTVNNSHWVLSDVYGV